MGTIVGLAIRPREIVPPELGRRYRGRREKSVAKPVLKNSDDFERKNRFPCMGREIGNLAFAESP